MRSEYEPSDVDEQVDEKEQRARLLEALAPSERLELKVLSSQLDALNLRLLALREAGLPVVHAVEGAQRRREVATAFLGYFTREALESNSVDSRLAEADLEGKSSVTANSFTFAAELSMLLLLKLEAPHLAAPLAKLRIAVTLLVEALTSSCDSSVVASCVADTSARELMPALAKLATQKQIASEAHATNALSSAEMAKLGTREMLSRVDALRVLGELQPETLGAIYSPFAEELLAGGGIGARRYVPGQVLMVRLQSSWYDATVEAIESTGDHLLLLGASGPGGMVRLQLNPWNHAPRELEFKSFARQLERHNAAVRARCMLSVDTISGKQVDVRQHCVALGVEGDGEMESIKDGPSLAKWLHAQHGERASGGAVERPAVVLVNGGNGAGKTTLLATLAVEASLKGELVPILISVRQLRRRLIASPSTFTDAWNWIDAFLRIEYANDLELYLMLRQAMMARRALILLDDLEEGSTMRAQIETHIAGVLGMQGHPLVCTSCSCTTGVLKATFAQCYSLRLLPLTETQQHRALGLRLGDEHAATLMAYLRETFPEPSPMCVPLMLAIVASVFQVSILVRRSELPTTITGLYALMVRYSLVPGLSPTGESSADELQIGRLLQTVCFRMHDQQRSQINADDLDAAAHAAGVTGHAVQALRERALRGSLPLLSTLSEEPLLLQPSHISFQEYFSARAICEKGTQIEGLLPWQWSAWWDSVLAFGGEMGHGFRVGLLRASGVADSTLNLRGKLDGGNRSTVLRALGVLSSVLTRLDLSGNGLGKEGSRTVSQFFHERDNSLTSINMLSTAMGAEEAELFVTVFRAQRSINTLCGLQRDQATANLSSHGLRPEDAILIATDLQRNHALTDLDMSKNQLYEARDACGISRLAEALNSNPTLRSLNLESNSLDSDAGKILATMLLGNTGLRRLNLACNELRFDGGTAIAEALTSSKSGLCELRISANGMGAQCCKVFAAMVKANATLTSLDLAGNGLGLEGACALAESLEENHSLQHLDMSENWLGGDGCRALASALSINTTLRSITLELGNPIPVQQLKGIEPVATLNLSGQALSFPSAVVISKLVQDNAVLKELDLARNTFTAESAQVIAEMITANTILRQLDLSANHICGLNKYGSGKHDVTGIRAIISAIESNQTLRCCHLIGNKLDCESATSLARVATRKGIMISGYQHNQKKIQPAAMAPVDHLPVGQFEQDFVLVASDVAVSAAHTPQPSSHRRNG